MAGLANKDSGMRISAKVILFSIIGITLFFVAIAAWFFSYIGAPPDYIAETKELDHWKFFIDVLEIIGVGFLLAALGFLIPPLLREAQHKIDRVESSRVAFVEATTAEQYLPTKVAALSYAGAVALIESIHLEKHRAETYEELHEHLKLKSDNHLEWHGRLSSTFDALIGVLEREAANWDSMDFQARLKLIRKAVPWKDVNPDA